MSNALMNLSAQALTMSSREIAELTDKRHDHVLRDVENMLHELGQTSPQFWGELPDSYSRPQRVAHLPKDLTFTLVAGYNVQMRHAIVVRWQELEAGQAPKLPQTLAQALRFAAEQAEEIERLAIERDTAVRTKAEIGSRREATAMATASAKFKEVARLQHELGRNQQHATVTAVEKVTGRDFGKSGFVPLRRITKSYGLEAVNVADQRYGNVKAWPAIAWREAYDIDLAELFALEEVA